MIVVNEPLTEDFFEFRLPSGMTFADGTIDGAAVEQLQKAHGLFETGKFDEALALYQQVLATCPPHALQARIGAYMLGTCYQALGQTAKAIEQSEKVIREDSAMAGEARKALERLRSAEAQRKGGPKPVQDPP